MKKSVLVDTGPLVAIFSKNDSYHDVCVAASKELAPPLVTSWPVLTEAAWLLRAYPFAVRQLLKSIEGGFLEPLEMGREFAGWCAAFVERYEDMGVQLADASLVYLAERESIETVFSLDRRDFSVYRTSRKRTLKIVP